MSNNKLDIKPILDNSQIPQEVKDSLSKIASNNQLDINRSNAEKLVNIVKNNDFDLTDPDVSFIWSQFFESLLKQARVDYVENQNAYKLKNDLVTISDQLKRLTKTKNTKVINDQVLHQFHLALDQAFKNISEREQLDELLNSYRNLINETNLSNLWYQETLRESLFFLTKFGSLDLEIGQQKNQDGFIGTARRVYSAYCLMFEEPGLKKQNLDELKIGFLKEGSIRGGRYNQFYRDSLLNHVNNRIFKQMSIEFNNNPAKGVWGANLLVAYLDNLAHQLSLKPQVKSKSWYRPKWIGAQLSVPHKQSFEPSRAYKNQTSLKQKPRQLAFYADLLTPDSEQLALAVSKVSQWHSSKQKDQLLRKWLTEGWFVSNQYARSLAQSAKHTTDVVSSFVDRVNAGDKQAVFYLDQLLKNGNTAYLKTLKANPQQMLTVIEKVAEINDKHIRERYLNVFLKDGVFNNACLTALMKDSQTSPKLPSKLASNTRLHKYINQKRILNISEKLSSDAQAGEQGQTIIWAVLKAKATTDNIKCQSAQDIADTIDELVQASQYVYDMDQSPIKLYLDKLLKQNAWKPGQTQLMNTLMSDTQKTLQVMKSIRQLRPDLASQYLSIFTQKAKRWNQLKDPLINELKEPLNNKTDDYSHKVVDDYVRIVYPHITSAKQDSDKLSQAATNAQQALFSSQNSWFSSQYAVYRQMIDSIDQYFADAKKGFQGYHYNEVVNALHRFTSLKVMFGNDVAYSYQTFAEPLIGNLQKFSEEDQQKLIAEFALLYYRNNGIAEEDKQWLGQQFKEGLIEQIKHPKAFNVLLQSELSYQGYMAVLNRLTQVANDLDINDRNDILNSFFKESLRQFSQDECIDYANNLIGTASQFLESITETSPVLQGVTSLLHGVDNPQLDQHNQNVTKLAHTLHSLVFDSSGNEKQDALSNTIKQYCSDNQSSVLCSLIKRPLEATISP